MIEKQHRFRLHGAAPYRIAVVHGGPGAPGTVFSLARALSAKRGVIEPFQSAHSLRGQVDELHSILCEAADLPAVLVGHSWGAWLSLLTAVAYPSSVHALILVSAPAFDASFLPLMQERRLAALSPDARDEYLCLIEQLQTPGEESSSQLSRLGELARRADDFCVDESEENREEPLPADGSAYRQVWGEASRLRATGELLELAAQIRCPVRAIHGLRDTTPMEGVERPLSGIVPDLKVAGIPESGHYPWKERFGRRRFFEIIEQELDFFQC